MYVNLLVPNKRVFKYLSYQRIFGTPTNLKNANLQLFSSTLKNYIVTTTIIKTEIWVKIYRIFL